MGSPFFNPSAETTKNSFDLYGTLSGAGSAGRPSLPTYARKIQKSRGGGAIQNYRLHRHSYQSYPTVHRPDGRHGSLIDESGNTPGRDESWAQRIDTLYSVRIPQSGL